MEGVHSELRSLIVAGDGDAGRALVVGLGDDAAADLSDARRGAIDVVDGEGDLPAWWRVLDQPADRVR